MKKSSSVLLSFSLVFSTLYLSFPTVYASETCTTDSGSGNGKNHVGETCIKKPSKRGSSDGSVRQQGEGTSGLQQQSPGMTEEEWKAYLAEHYSEEKTPSGDTYYVSKTTGGSCITTDGKPGKLNPRMGYGEGGKIVQAVPRAPLQGKQMCVATDDKPAEQIEQERVSYEEQVAEIKRRFVEMNPATPQLRLNDYPSPHVWKDENAHFYVDFEGSNQFEGELKAGRVRIEAVPISYAFESGDGGQYTSSVASGKLRARSQEEMPKTPNSYMYKESGNYHAYVTVTYTGRFKVGDGPWHPIDGQITKTSEAALVRVWEVETHNVAKLCTEDPTAWACPGSKYRPDYNNPNPRLAVPDPHTGQQWHKDNAGSGDTEWWRKPAKKQTRSR